MLRPSVRWCTRELKLKPLREYHDQLESTGADSRGGGHTADNVVPACRHCNAKKKDRPVFVMVNAA